MNCIICGNSQHKIIKESVRDDKLTNVVVCISCKHQQLTPIRHECQIQEFYNLNLQAKEINHNLNIDEIREKSLSDIYRREDTLIKHISNPHEAKILDIGTGYGFFIEHMEQCGCKIEGIEISSSRRQIAQSICKSKIFNYNILLDRHINTMLKKYDIVTMFQVLEHIVEPVKFLENVKQIISNNGKIIIEVPNADDHLIEQCYEYKNFFYQTAHVSYFTRDTLSMLLKQCGFKKIEFQGVQRYSIENFMNWLILKKPQLVKPSHEVSGNLQWLDNYYKENLCRDFKCDTLLAIAE